MAEQQNTDLELSKEEEEQAVENIYEEPEERLRPVMNDDEYITERLENQMNWFDRKSSWHQKHYKRLKRWEFGIGATIPVLVSFSASCDLGSLGPAPYAVSLSWLLQIFASVAGVVLVFITKHLELEDHYKLWKDYRANAEQLQHELMLYTSRTKPYDTAQAYHDLVENIEGLLNKENMKWQQSGHEKQQQEQPKQDDNAKH